MGRNENLTCRELIEPALRDAGWEYDTQVIIGPGQVNLTGETMYDETQKIIADYVVRLWRMPLAILEAKAEDKRAVDGVQQASRYARRLGLRFSMASNGHEYILTDNETGHYDTFPTPPSPADILNRLGNHQIDWEKWRPAFDWPWHEDQVTRKKVRLYQEMAVFETLCRFSRDIKKVLLLMAAGTGKTFTVFQLVWKLIHGDVLKRNHILFLTDRNNLREQAKRAFHAFFPDERVTIDKETIKRSEHLVGKIFFANYQTLNEELDGRKLYEYFDPDFFDLVVVDECHRSGFGDWFGALKHFSSAYQLGLTATPRELDQNRRTLTEEELRRDTFEYFGGPAYVYSLKQAVEDGYLVPYLLEERITNLDENGYTGPDGRQYTTDSFERDIRLPDRTRIIAEDVWSQLGKYGLREEKSIVFCVDDTHAAFMAQELRRLSGDSDYAARITRSERNSYQLERNFAEVGRAKPRIAVTVDLLSTGFDAPDAKNIVFARPIKSAILYKQMKGRGTRLCEDIDKRYFTIFDYAAASELEDAEFDGHPANLQKSRKPSKRTKKSKAPEPKPIADGISVFISSTERYVCLADGRKIPFEEYLEQSKEVVNSIAAGTLDELLRIWISKETRQDLRAELKDRDIHIAALRVYMDLDNTDDVDILAKVGFDLPRVPTRHDRVVRFWEQEEQWLRQLLGIEIVAKRPAQIIEFPSPKEYSVVEDMPYAKVAEGQGEFKTSDFSGTQEPPRIRFWQTCLDHYAMFGIDDLERGSTYSAPQFVEQFGSFRKLLNTYGGAMTLKSDLEAVKEHLYVPMLS